MNRQPQRSFSNLGTIYFLLREVDRRLCSLCHATRLDAVCAHVDFFNMTGINSTYPLEIGVETAFVNIMCMADVISNHGFFTTYCALF